MENIVKYIILFFFYSFAGWCLESTYCSIGEKKLINRGFLTGPLCPIYGTAAIVLILLIYNPFKDNILIVFLLGVLLCDIVEFITSYVMEKLFAARWWDYTYEFCNINGRICLKHSLYWGIISVAFVKIIHPAVDGLYLKINGEYLVYILTAILLVFIIDVLNAVRKALDIRKLYVKLKNHLDILTDIYGNLKGTVEEKYEIIKDTIENHSAVVDGFKEQIEDTIYQFDIRFVRKKKDKDNKKKRGPLSSRIFYNNPDFEKRTKNQILKLKSLIEDIKESLIENK